MASDGTSPWGGKTKDTRTSGALSEFGDRMLTQISYLVADMMTKRIPPEEVGASYLLDEIAAPSSELPDIEEGIDAADYRDPFNPSTQDKKPVTQRWHDMFGNLKDLQCISLGAIFDDYTEELEAYMFASQGTEGFYMLHDQGNTYWYGAVLRAGELPVAGDIPVFTDEVEYGQNSSFIVGRTPVTLTDRHHLDGYRTIRDTVKSYLSFDQYDVEMKGDRFLLEIGDDIKAHAPAPAALSYDPDQYDEVVALGTDAKKMFPIFLREGADN